MIISPHHSVILILTSRLCLTVQHVVPQLSCDGSEVGPTSVVFWGIPVSDKLHSLEKVHWGHCWGVIAQRADRALRSASCASYRENFSGRRWAVRGCAGRLTAADSSGG